MTEKEKLFISEYKEYKNFEEALMASKLNIALTPGDQYYVYLLIDPSSGEIFYIGKGKKNRAYQHVCNNKRGNIDNADKHRIINDIFESGEEPQVIIFKNNLTEEAAFSLERKMIRSLKAYITNKSSGITHKYEKRKEWARACLRKRMPYNKWLMARPRSEKDKELYFEIWDTLEKVASGEEKLYDTVIFTQKNGFTCVEVS